MRGATVVLCSVIVTALMLIPSCVSAGASMMVEDSADDLGFGVDVRTSEIARPLPDKLPVADAAYLDILSVSLAQKGRAYVFEMEMSADLPVQGTALPGNTRLAEWAVWIDPEPFHVSDNPVTPLFLIALRYDGMEYSAFMLDYSTLTFSPVEYSVNGNQVRLEFTSASIGGIAIEWWSPLVRVWWGVLGSAGYWFVDAIDHGMCPGQVYYDLPWPPE